MDPFVRRNTVTVPLIREFEDDLINPFGYYRRTPGYKARLQDRRRLPVIQELERILKTKHTSPVFVLTGDPGSGKSTQIPHMLAYDELDDTHGYLRVACTQPHRLAAKELARRVAIEMDVKLGEEVGYQTRGDSNIDQGEKRTRVSYMTEDVLFGTHERTKETDLLLAVLKKVAARRYGFRVVIISSNINGGLFQNYFGGCPLIHVTGQKHKVKTIYVKQKDESLGFVVRAVRMALDIHKKKRPGDILVFLPGRGEVEKACNLLRQGSETLTVLPLHSGLAGNEEPYVLHPSANDQNRRCIVATNIAETGLAISNIVYVIDCGLSIQSVYNPGLRMDMPQVVPVTQASANQRAGKAGRTQDGICFRLYSRLDFYLMAPSNEPAIRHSSVHSTLLTLLLTGTGSKHILDFDWIDTPSPDALRSAVMDLQDWGFLTPAGKLTKLGTLAARMPLEPLWFHALKVALSLGCGLEMIDIAIMCTGRNSILAQPDEHGTVCDRCATALACGASDHVRLANACNCYRIARQSYWDGNEPRDLEAWCARNFLNYNALEETRVARNALTPYLMKFMEPELPQTSPADPSVVRKALAIAFCTRCALSKGDSDVYRTVNGNVVAHLEPHSSLVGRNSEWVVFSDLYMTGDKVYMSTCTSINPEWIMDLPCFQADRIPLEGDGLVGQEQVQKSLDAARARAKATKQ